MVIVIGGHGYLGRRMLRGLALAGVSACSAGRSPRASSDRVVDLRRPATFSALAGASAIINVSNSSAAPPDALARHCLDAGLLLLEATSDRMVMERLLELRGDGRNPGAVVLGAGIFTGVSNVLAAAAARALGGAEALELVVASSPFSGAGLGTVELMVSSLSTPTLRIVGGERRLGPAVAAGPTIELFESTRPTLAVPLAEPAMLHASMAIPDIAMYLAPKPSFLARTFLATPPAIAQSRWYGALMRGYFRFLRSVLLEQRPTSVELVAIARSARGERRMALRTEDGMSAAGVAGAAMVDLLLEGRDRPRGVVCIDEVIELDGLLARCARIAPGTFQRRDD